MKSRRRKRTPFPSPNSEVWYDLEHDAELITQSVAKQYKLLPAEQEKIHYSEWLLLVGGLMEDTPLGQIVLIRKEKDRDRIKRFTPYEMRIHNEWRSFRTKKMLSNAKPEDFSKQFEKMFSAMFG